MKYQNTTDPYPVLIVDDNIFNVYSLRNVLEEFYNLKSDVAYSGIEGIRCVNDRLLKNIKPYKLILTDINMPEMDGLQMAKKIKKMFFKRQRTEFGQQSNEIAIDTKIYAITAMNDDYIKDTFHLYGLEAVLTKPVNLNGLRPVIEDIFSK